jgi:sec-independent protein translocase protein TatA
MTDRLVPSMSTREALVDVGAPELLIVLAVVLLLFGSKKLPELARGIGRSVKEFRKGAAEDDETSG